MMPKYVLMAALFLLYSCVQPTEKAAEATPETQEHLAQEKIAYEDYEIPALAEASAPRFEEPEQDTITLDSFNRLFIGLESDCYGLPGAIRLDSLYTTHHFYSQSVHIHLPNDSVVAYNLQGILLSFQVQNDSVYRLIHSSSGENLTRVYLVTLNSTFEEIDRVELSINGGDEEDTYSYGGCFRARNKYVRSGVYSWPIVGEALYEERYSSYQLNILANGEMEEIKLIETIDTISTLLELGEYLEKSGSGLLRILPRKKVQFLQYTETGEVADSLFGNYHYGGRQPYAEFELHQRHTDEYGIAGFKTLWDTVEILNAGSCLVLRNEKYYRN